MGMLELETKKFMDEWAGGWTRGIPADQSSFPRVIYRRRGKRAWKPCGRPELEKSKSGDL
jgi:hypothetical protein